MPLFHILLCTFPTLHITHTHLTHQPNPMHKMIKSYTLIFTHSRKIKSPKSITCNICIMHSPELDDFIGGESCVDFTPDVLVDPTPTRNLKKSSRPTAPKEYPPPIQQFPWVMKRYSTSDGRLVIKEEKSKRCHYLRAHRSNGRLLLDLVEESNYSEVSGDEESKFDGVDGIINDDPTVEAREGEEVSSHREIESQACGSEVGGVNPCGGFRVQVAAFRPPVLT